MLAFSAIRLELPAGRLLFRADTKAQSGFVIMVGFQCALAIVLLLGMRYKKMI